MMKNQIGRKKIKFMICNPLHLLVKLRTWRELHVKEEMKKVLDSKDNLYLLNFKRNLIILQDHLKLIKFQIKSSNKILICNQVSNSYHITKISSMMSLGFWMSVFIMMAYIIRTKKVKMKKNMRSSIFVHLWSSIWIFLSQ